MVVLGSAATEAMPQVLIAPSVIQRSRLGIRGLVTMGTFMRAAALQVVSRGWNDAGESLQGEIAMKMQHDEFETWIRDRCRGCLAQDEIDQLCIGELDFDSGEYTFSSTEVQGQWEAWQAATEHAKKTACNRN